MRTQRCERNHRDIQYINHFTQLDRTFHSISYLLPSRFLFSFSLGRTREFREPRNGPLFMVWAGNKCRLLLLFLESLLLCLVFTLTETTWAPKGWAGCLVTCFSVQWRRLQQWIFFCSCWSILLQESFATPQVVSRRAVTTWSLTTLAGVRKQV